MLGQCKRERCVALSTCEAELVAASMCAASVCYLRLLLEEIGYEQREPTRIFVDNVAAKFVSCDPVQSAALKHVKRRQFFSREMQELGEVSVVWIASKLNVADAFTKCLPHSHFEFLISALCGTNSEMTKQKALADRGD